MKFYIVDVFGSEKYSGNQLAVVVAPKMLSTIEMQKIAQEFHFSETTFVTLENSFENEFQVNIFTPQSEVPFAGHPTLGTAYIIRNEIINSQVSELIFNLKVGKISVLFDDTANLQWMKQIEPIFGAVHDPKQIAPLINTSLDALDLKFPIQNISTGIEFMLIPLKSLDSIKTVSINLAFYKEYFKGIDPKPIFLFCPETYEKENKINCRMFADIFGIPEDPATGSANGCLSAYLTKYNYFNTKKIDIAVEQGYEIDRKSILYVQSDYKDEKYNIKIGGKVIKVAEGHLS